jgi:hypothetical protein
MSTLRRVATANVANAEQFEEYNSFVDIWTRDGFEIEHHEQSAQYVMTVFVKRERNDSFVYVAGAFVIGTLLVNLVSDGGISIAGLVANSLWVFILSVNALVNAIRKTS